MATSCWSYLNASVFWDLAHLENFLIAMSYWFVDLLVMVVVIGLAYVCLIVTNALGTIIMTRLADSSSNPTQWEAMGRLSSFVMRLSALIRCSWNQPLRHLVSPWYTQTTFRTAEEKYQVETVLWAWSHICITSFFRGLLDWFCISTATGRRRNSWARRTMTRCRPSSGTFCLVNGRRERRTWQCRQLWSYLALPAWILSKFA